MFRRYNRAHSRFDQPDPYDGSYDLTNPQSFNRYSYTQNDPVTFVDPRGLDGELGGWIGITLNPPSGSVTITGSFDDFFRHGGSSGDGTEWRTLAVIDPGDLNAGIAGSIQLKPQRLTDDQHQPLVEELSRLLKTRKDCMEFVSSLLFTVAVNTQRPLFSFSPTEIFKAI